MIFIRLVCFVMLFVSLFGCNGKGDKDGIADLQVVKVSVWKLSADGVNSPAPRGMDVDAKGRLYVVDTSARITIFSQNGKRVGMWKMPENSVGNPEDIKILANGNVLIPDTHYHRVIVFSPEGKELFRFGEFGRGEGQFIYPVSAAEDDEGNIYVCEYGSNDRIQKFSATGKFLLEFGSFGTGAGQFQRPSGVIWYGGRVYVSDGVNNRVVIYGDDGKYVGELQGQGGDGFRLRFPYDIDLDREKEEFWVVEWSAGRVVKFAMDGSCLGVYGSAGRGRGNFCTPWGIVYDGVGDCVFVADTGNRRVVRLQL